MRESAGGTLPSTKNTPFRKMDPSHMGPLQPLIATVAPPNKRHRDNNPPYLLVDSHLVLGIKLVAGNKQLDLSLLNPTGAHHIDPSTLAQPRFLALQDLLNQIGHHVRHRLQRPPGCPVAGLNSWRSLRRNQFHILCSPSGFSK